MSQLMTSKRFEIKLIRYWCLIIFVLASQLATTSVKAGVIEHMTEQENKRSVGSPVRAGKVSFKHEISNAEERDEFEFKKTVIGNTYWYGHSYFLPENFPDGGSGKNGFTLISQYGAYPSANKWPCRGIGSHLLLNSGEGRGTPGKLTFVLQAKAGDGPVKCTQHVIADIKDMKNKWTDIVMHVKWTGNEDGFLKLWVRHGDGQYVQKMDLKGATFANNEGNGPYMKLGVYVGNPGNGARLLYIDEYRLGDSNSSFEEVAPGGKGTPPTPKLTHTIQLQKNWNLLSLPINPSDNDIADVLAPINGQYVAVHAYDGKEYESYYPGDDSSKLKKMEAGRGYWIFMKANAALQVDGSVASKTVMLKKDWNLVGFNATNPISVPQAISSIKDKVSAIYAYNSETNSYIEPKDFEPGMGYWVLSTSDNVTWTLP
jgi:hypothetical protein